MEAEEAQPIPPGQRTKLLTYLPDNSRDGDKEEAQEDDGQGLEERDKEK